MCLTAFDTQFADLSEFDTVLANSFSLGVSYLFSLISLFPIFFSIFGPHEKTTMPLPYPFNRNWARPIGPRPALFFPGAVVCARDDPLPARALSPGRNSRSRLLQIPHAEAPPPGKGARAAARGGRLREGRRRVEVPREQRCRNRCALSDQGLACPARHRGDARASTTLLCSSSLNILHLHNKIATP